MQTQPSRIDKHYFAWLVLLALPYAQLCWADQPGDSKENLGVANRSPVKDIAYWIDQLSADHYLRREMAEQKLIESGTEAVGGLSAVLDSGELESIERATSILIQIGTNNAPAEDGGAWQQLDRIAGNAAGLIASNAKRASTEIADYRASRARSELTAAGISVATDEFMIRAVVDQAQTVLQIDERWNGDEVPLQWLPWLPRVKRARIKGPAANREVIAAVSKVPSLEHLELNDVEIKADDLKPLVSAKPIRTLAFRYVSLDDEAAKVVSKIPIRDALTLMGTGISLSRYEAMRKETPGLQIEFRQGGFLGVSCSREKYPCAIDSVTPGSAAEAAGLIPQDVVVRLGKDRIRRFEDLQAAINRHVAGDEVELEFTRGGISKVTKVTLRRYVNR